MDTGKIPDNNYSRNGAIHEQILRLLNSFTFYGIVFFWRIFQR